MNKNMLDYYKKFKELPWEIRFFIEQEGSVAQIKSLEKKHGIALMDLIYMIVARVVFIDNIEGYIQEIFGKSKKEAGKISSDLKSYILEPIIDYLYEDLEKNNYWDNPENSANRIKKIFKKNFLNVLDYYYNHKKIEQIDEEVYFLLGYFDNFQRELLKTMAENNEVLTSQNIVIDGKIEPGTVGNWIKDFIKETGISNVNNLSISKYLVYSANPKKITDLEKEKIKKIITVYRNIKNFFDDLLEVQDGKEIKIIPFYQKEEEKKAITVDSLNQKITDKERQEYREEKVEKLEKDFSREIEKKAIEEEVLNKKDFSHLEEEKKSLQKMLDQYKENSLERKAVEEELEKL